MSFNRIYGQGLYIHHSLALAHTIIENVLLALNEKPQSKEGMPVGEWILLDDVNVGVHIFQEEKREFYAFEELWGDGKKEVVK